MAPAACDTIWQNLQDFGRSPEDYSRIITGDLGYVDRAFFLNCCLKKVMISVENTWTVV